jgi:SAM-dependent methyltransferase
MLVRLVLVGLLVSSLALLADWSIEYGSMHEAFKRHLTAASPTAPVPDCVANLFTGVTPSDYEVVLAREGRSYNAGHKFKKKVKEASKQWASATQQSDVRLQAIHAWLSSLLKDKHDLNVLELGFGGGINMIAAEQLMNWKGNVWGVELTEGWVAHARENFKHERLHFLVGDITRAADVLKKGGAGDVLFDVIYLADVWEHIPSYRLKHLWETIVSLLKPTGLLYIHIPGVEMQLAERNNDKAQFFEQVVRVDDFQKQAECFSMEIRQTEYEKSGYVSVIAGFKEPKHLPEADVSTDEDIKSKKDKANRTKHHRHKHRLPMP